MTTVADSFAELENKLAELANAQFASPEYNRLLGMRWTREAGDLGSRERRADGRRRARRREPLRAWHARRRRARPFDGRFLEDTAIAGHGGMLLCLDPYCQGLALAQSFAGLRGDRAFQFGRDHQGRQLLAPRRHEAA